MTTTPWDLRTCFSLRTRCRSMAVLWLLLASWSAWATETCRIVVVEKGSGWPVPLVQLRTTGNLRFVTDNAGVIAIERPELMDREVFFHVNGTGYEVPKDGFGNRGVRLTPKAGKTLRVDVTRTILAKRLGRLTGAGLFTHAQRLGDHQQWRESGVVGCDTVQLAAHRERLVWLWGDTNLFHYPLGIFHASAATTPVRPLTSFEPPIAIDFQYFRDDSGRPRGVAKMPGKGPTWLSALVSLPDATGQPRLVATYAKINPPLDAYQHGICVWDETAKSFDSRQVIWNKSKSEPKPPPLPTGHAVLWTDPQGERHVLFGNPLPTLSCPASLEAFLDPAQWMTHEPQKTIESRHGPIQPHSGSIAWNAWRKRWVTVFMQSFGAPSTFGEIWYAEADSPMGPWGPAVKILSHEKYTFYNPRVHPELSPENSPILLFEGTYTKMFSNQPTATPAYDYNQILYRIDLDDKRLQAATNARRESP